MLAAPPDRRLARRPEATAFAVEDLLAKVKDGELRLPRFQRGLKWLPSDDVNLFDSLYRGFPVGTLLLWKRKAEAGTVTFGDFKVEARARADALWIVDGQQRVAALASHLLVDPAPRARAMLFDVEAESFKVGLAPAAELQPALPGAPPGGAPVPPVRVLDLFDSTRAITWMAARYQRFRPELVQRALDCGKRLRDYHVPVYIVETDDEDLLREIFDRINRAGRRLDDTDVFTALFATTSTEGERLDLGHVARRLVHLGFGTLEEKTVLRCLRAVKDLPLDKDFTKAMTLEASAEALDATEAALERAVKFLKEAGFPHRALVPYDLLFVVLARFFDRHPEPRLRDAILLRRWVWRGSLAGKLAGATVSLRQHVEAVGEDASQSVQRLLRLDGGSSDAAAPDIDLGAFRLSTAKSELAACALASLVPRDLRTGEPVDVGRLFETDPTKPLPLLVASDAAGLSRSVANRILHPTLTTKEATALVVGATPEVLASHAIPPEARDAIARGDAEGFLRARAAHLTARARDFFMRQSEHGADDSPPLDTLVTDEEP